MLSDACDDTKIIQLETTSWWIITFDARRLLFNVSRCRVIRSFNEKLNDASSAASINFVRFSDSISDRLLLCYLISRYFRCSSWKKQEIVPQLISGWRRGRRREARNEVGNEKCFTNRIESLCYKNLFRDLSSRREIIERMLDASQASWMRKIQQSRRCWAKHKFCSNWHLMLTEF